MLPAPSRRCHCFSNMKKGVSEDVQLCKHDVQQLSLYLGETGALEFFFFNEQLTFSSYYTV